jgi:signal transduction histidine kinase
MKLACFIEGNLEVILREWDVFAASFPAAASMSLTALRDHAREILLAVVADMQTSQTSREQKEKSLGHDDDDVPSGTGSAATIHGELRHEVGFDLVQLVAEYRALRASVLRLWVRHELPPDAGDFEDMLRFNEAIDQAVAESVSSYSLELEKARDTFTAILGHDLRSPLGAILMSAHNAAAHDIPEPAMRAMEAIQRNAKQMHLLIRDLLDFAGQRLGRGLPMHPEESSLIETCRAAIAELMASHPSRTFEFEHDGDLQGYFDPARIGQALSNLLNNAINHGESGCSVNVRARAEAREMVVDVTNMGRTIPPDALRAIMDDPIASVHPGSEGSSGLSLGLYIAQQVAKGHGGSLTAVSQDNETRFSLHLPRERPLEPETTG